MPVGAGRRARWLAVPVVVAVLAAACGAGGSARPPAAALGDVRAGQQALGSYGCGACHQIPGVRGADALVGPPLTSFGQRSFIAGVLPNNQPNLERWIQDPQGVAPGSAMPDVGVTEPDARDMAAYLLSLE